MGDPFDLHGPHAATRQKVSSTPRQGAVAPTPTSEPVRRPASAQEPLNAHRGARPPPAPKPRSAPAPNSPAPESRQRTASRPSPTARTLRLAPGNADKLVQLQEELGLDGTAVINLAIRALWKAECGGTGS